MGGDGKGYSNLETGAIYGLIAQGNIRQQIECQKQWNS
jgi:hypothetical protein